jgi:hypothetical protein
MHRALAALLIALPFVSLLFTPLAAHAQFNICEFSDAACSSPKSVGSPCPCLVPGSEPPVIPGICVGVNDCRATLGGLSSVAGGAVSSFIAANPLTSIGIAAGAGNIFSTLMSGAAGGSSQSSDTGITDTTFASLDQTVTDSTFTAPAGTNGIARNDTLSPLIAGLGTAQPATIPINLTAAQSTPCGLPNSAQSNGSPETNALLKALSPGCSQII